MSLRDAMPLALRREGLFVGVGAFVKVGVVVMPPALLLVIAGPHY